jgi:hypothetical protein
VKGTRLWNAPRSPLIEGRSRRQTTFTIDWIRGSVVGFLLGAALASLFFADKGASLRVLTSLVLIPASIGAVAGAGLGVRMAAGFGWHPRWVSGGVAGALVSLVAVTVVFFYAIGTGV